MLTTLQIQNSLTPFTLGAVPLPGCVPTRSTVTSDSSDTYTSTLRFVSSPSPSSLAPGCPSTPTFSSPLTHSGFVNEMLAVSEQGALNYYTFFRPIPLTLSVFRNPIFTHFLSRFLGVMLCDLIAPTPGLAFFLVMPRTLAATSSSSSGRTYLSLNFLPPLFLRLIPTLIM